MPQTNMHKSQPTRRNGSAPFLTTALLCGVVGLLTGCGGSKPTAEEIAKAIRPKFPSDYVLTVVSVEVTNVNCATKVDGYLCDYEVLLKGNRRLMKQGKFYEDPVEQRFPKKSYLVKGDQGWIDQPIMPSML
ncbi:hypothetical protein AEP_01635 [Curvibacter sp. AEP1-3]|nr:hypothetical protein AEP_01635 [Curvibacter sp. AEP1-3]